MNIKGLSSLHGMKVRGSGWTLHLLRALSRVQCKRIHKQYVPTSGSRSTVHVHLLHLYDVLRFLTCTVLENVYISGNLIRL